MQEEKEYTIIKFGGINNMQNVLVVVDMQNDFIDGALGTKEAVAIVPKVIEKISSFKGKIFFTRDTHPENYMETQEGSKLPVPHCIKGTEGWELQKEIGEFSKESPVDKPTFGSKELAEQIQKLNEVEEIETITMIGLCTDICVISNAMIVKAYLPEVEIIVDASCCAGVTPESHMRALEAMKVCQITVVNE